MPTRLRPYTATSYAFPLLYSSLNSFISFFLPIIAILFLCFILPRFNHLLNLWLIITLFLPAELHIFPHSTKIFFHFNTPFGTFKGTLCHFRLLNRLKFNNFDVLNSKKSINHKPLTINPQRRLRLPPVCSALLVASNASNITRFSSSSVPSLIFFRVYCKRPL